MLNLLSNAIKYSPPGSPIAVMVAREDAAVLVQVHDDGVGIPKDRMALLFRTFSRLGGSEDASIAGVGLGLAICKGIIDAHGGRISVQSPGRGEGSTFTFTLPLNAPGDTAMPSYEMGQAGPFSSLP
jgi:signal transduction histidine kinase